MVIAVNDIASVREASRNPSMDGKPDLMLTQLRAPDFKTRGKTNNLIYTGPVMTGIVPRAFSLVNSKRKCPEVLLNIATLRKDGHFEIVKIS